jgi:hypothetical protein
MGLRRLSYMVIGGSRAEFVETANRVFEVDAKGECENYTHIWLVLAAAGLALVVIRSTAGQRRQLRRVSIPRPFVRIAEIEIRLVPDSHEVYLPRRK